VLQTQPNCSAQDVAAKEEELAVLLYLVANLLRRTLLASNYELAEENYQ